MSQSDKFAITDAEFALFVILWNQRMGAKTPDIHLRMARWLERRWEKGETRLLLMAFRSAGKSTIAGLFTAWLLYRNPDLRILVLAADYTLAQKMVRNVKRIIERHPLTAGRMRPDKPDQWASDRFTVKRNFELRDPSMLARGIGSNITGSRADLILCDDVEVPLTCDSAEKRAELRERLLELDYVLVPGGRQLYIGTPHNYYTIYADGPRTDIGEERAFLHDFTRLELPVLDAGGQSVWPERYGEGDITRMKAHTGPNKFASQMMLKPVNIAEGRLDPDLLRIYEGEFHYAKELRQAHVGGRVMASASAWWDPAFGSASGDRSVLACLFADDEGNSYLHRLEYLKIAERSGEDEATQQCRIVAGIAKELMLPSLTVETNGIGKFLPAILRNEIARANIPCAVQEASSSRAKDLRILEAFDAVLAARRLYAHKSVCETPFMSEMREWRPGTKRGHDDGLDAVAGALSLQPVRLKKLYGAAGGPHRWMKNTGPHKADIGFEV